ncbi:MAG: hypothetical protein AB1603_01515, partial [Chloroflexota bacterium]
MTGSGSRLAGNEPSLDPSRQKKARDYARSSRALFFVDLALSGAVLVALILTGLSSGAGNMLAWAPRPLAAVVYF